MLAPTLLKIITKPPKQFLCIERMRYGVARQKQLEIIRAGRGFIAALDQSGGSTPKALTAYGVRTDDYINDEIKEVNENGTNGDTEKEYDENKDPLLTDKRNYMDTLSKQLEFIARNNNKLDIDFIDPSTLKPEKYKTINKALNDELESFKRNKILFDSWVVRFQMVEKQKLKRRSFFS